MGAGRTDCFLRDLYNFKINSARVSLDSLCKSLLLKCTFLEARYSAFRKVMLFIHSPDPAMPEIVSAQKGDEMRHSCPSLIRTGQSHRDPIFSNGTSKFISLSDAESNG